MDEQVDGHSTRETQRGGHADMGIERVGHWKRRRTRGKSHARLMEEGVEMHENDLRSRRALSTDLFSREETPAALQAARMCV